MSAIAIMLTKDNIDIKSQENLGRYALSNTASIAHPPNRSSTKILKAKFFPVINGKNIVSEITNGIKGIRNMPISNAY
jgi:hypothetical protein